MNEATTLTTTKRTRVSVKKILYLTDFSEPSEAALPFAVTIAKTSGAKIYALHVLTPVIAEAYAGAMHADEVLAQNEMAVVDSKLATVPHEVAITSKLGVWAAVEQNVRQHNIDLIVLGTHGRTGAGKLLFGSFAEEIFRRSNVPVLTIGRHVSIPTVETKLRKILFATDFSLASKAAAPIAIALAEENNAKLILLHVLPADGHPPVSQEALEQITARVKDIVPGEATASCEVSAKVERGDIADHILKLAAHEHADLIVLGVRHFVDHMGLTTHLERAIAHKVVAHAPCPVLTVRN